MRARQGADGVRCDGRTGCRRWRESCASTLQRSEQEEDLDSHSAPLAEKVEQGAELEAGRHDAEDDGRPDVATCLPVIFLCHNAIFPCRRMCITLARNSRCVELFASGMSCSPVLTCFITHATLPNAPRLAGIDLRAALLACVAMAACALSCDPVTAPELFVYADRPVVIPQGSGGWQSVSVGAAHSCAIRLDGHLYCWGSNASGQLGVGEARGKCGRPSSECEGGPRAVAPALRFVAVSAGQRHACAITTEQVLYCWGENLQFQTATQGEAFVHVPVVVAPSLNFMDVGAGATHSCAVRTNGVVYCWGDGTLGALGRGDTVSSVFPAPIASAERFVRVRSGRLRSCAIALDGGLWCWGLEWESTDGNLDFFHERLSPHRIAGLPPVRDVSVSSSSICAVALDGTAYCWEANGFAQLGLGNIIGTAIPTAVLTSERFTGVSSGIIQSCGTANDGRAFCWGNNSFGQLGVPRPGEHCGAAALECSSRPIAVFGEQRFQAVTTGAGNHSCGVTVSSAVLCWGLGSAGQLGDGYLRDRQSLPVGVLAPAP